MLQAFTDSYNKLCKTKLTSYTDICSVKKSVFVQTKNSVKKFLVMCSGWTDFNKYSVRTKVHWTENRRWQSSRSSHTRQDEIKKHKKMPSQGPNGGRCHDNNRECSLFPHFWAETWGFLRFVLRYIIGLFFFCIWNYFFFFFATNMRLFNCFDISVLCKISISFD